MRPTVEQPEEAPMYNSVADKLRFALLRKIARTMTLVCILGSSGGLLYLGDRYHLTILSVLGGILMLLGVFVMIFVLPEVFLRMEEKGTFLFGPAIIHTLYGHALKLTFVPLIGPAIERGFFRKKAPNPLITDRVNGE